MPHLSALRECKKILRYIVGESGVKRTTGQSKPPTLIHLPELPSSFRDSHYLRVTLLHVLNHRWRIVFNCECPNTHRGWRTPIPNQTNTHSQAPTPTTPIRVFRIEKNTKPLFETCWQLQVLKLDYLLDPFSGVEIHMEMDMDWKWMEMGHNLWKSYGLVWIWRKAISLKRYNRYGTFIKHDISNTDARLYPKNTAVIEKYVPNLKHWMQAMLIF